jgi:EmrB/QacA subfamily drug resistance transporter
MFDLDRKTLRPGRPGAAAPAGRLVTVLLTSVAYFMVTLDSLVVVTALPAIHRQLGGGVATLQWTVSAYTMAFGAGIITAAALGDRLGRRRVYTAGLLIFTLGSAACAVAPDAGALIACRAVQGIGAACIMPLGLTLLTSAFPPSRRGAVVGIWGGIAGLAVACGPLVGGSITQGLSWHWIFWVNVPIGIVAAAGARLRLAESRGPAAPLDVPALVLVSAGVGLLIWGIVEGGQSGWGSAQNIAGLILGSGLFAGFLLREVRTSTPMVPLTLFRSATFSAAGGAQFFMSAAIFSAAFLTSQFFQFALGDTPLATGLRFLPWTAAPLVVAPVAGALSDKLGSRALVVPGLVMQAAGFAWIVSLAGTSRGYADYVPALILAGVGISMALPSVTAAGLNAAPPRLLGKAAGTLNTLQQFGVVVGIAVVTAVFNSTGSLASPAEVTHGYRPAMTLAAGLSLLGAVAALGMRHARRSLAEATSSARTGADPGPDRPPGTADLDQLLPGGRHVIVLEVFQVLVLGILVLEVLVLQVFELDAVQFGEAVSRVGLAAGVGSGGPGEGIAGLLRAPGRQQRVRVGVEEPRGPRAQPAAGQFGHLQGHDGGLGKALIPADARLDDAELDLHGPAEFAGLRLAYQRQRPVQPAQGPLAVGHDRQVLVPAGHAPRGAQLSQGFGPPTGLVGGDAAGLPDHADPRREALGGLGVVVGPFRVFGQTGGHQVTGHAVGQVVRQAVQLSSCLRIELLGTDRVGDLRPGLVGRPGTASRRLVPPSPGASATRTWLAPVAPVLVPASGRSRGAVTAALARG